MKLTLMSYNLEHLLDYVRYQSLPKDRRYDCIDLDLHVSAIARVAPDILVLNEVRGRGSGALYFNTAEQLAARLGMHVFFSPAVNFPGGGPYGNAVLSKFPIVKAERILIPDPEVRDENTYYETRCIIRAELDCGVTVYGSHFGLARSERQNAVAALVPYLDAEDRPCVFMGDLNLLPDDSILDPVRARLTDTADFFTEPKFSVQSPDPHRKIDYIFVSRDIRVLSADIPAIVASDHRPHTAVVEVG